MKRFKINKKYQVLLIIIGIFLLILGTSYAYFTVSPTGINNQNIVTSGLMKITYIDGPEVTLENAIPGDSITKTFSITNTGNVVAYYDVLFTDVINTFEDSSDLVYKILNDNDEIIQDETQMPITDDALLSSENISPGETITFKLQILFLNKDKAQDTNQGKTLSGKIQINSTSNNKKSKIDTSVVAYYNGEAVSTIPENDGNTQVYKISCTNNASGIWNNDTWNLTIDNMAELPINCSIYFGSYQVFDYTKAEQTFTASEEGYYELETWGAQGGTAVNGTGGYGAYSIGIVKLLANQQIFVYVGGSTTTTAAGYNGGGEGLYTSAGGGQFRGGGGATHIALTSGLLSTQESTQDNVLIVAAGGGGGGYNDNTWRGSGGNAGGFIGNTGYNYGGNNTAFSGTGATQTTGGYDYSSTSNGLGSFGKGGDYDNLGYGGNGGGSGWYGGGGSSRYHGGGGGGSSYIGNSLLLSSSSITKSMYCNTCEESSDTNTKTISVSDKSATPTSNIAKTGNGYAKISFIGKSLN